MSDIVSALASGRVTATALTNGYLARIEAYDRDGPMLNSVRELNPDALTIAGRLDDTKPSVKQPLAGIPILVKDKRHGRIHEPTQARRHTVRRQYGCRDRRQGGLSQRHGAWRFHFRHPRHGRHARLSAWRHLRRPRLERAQASASGVRLRAGFSNAQTAAWLACPLEP
ncbi:MAG: hypothetical protein J2P54_26850 [Bradyrhizobiaceae bacterium]|nr:hypothetical protein [Bradyrhizobiaceae bacterium]